MEAARIWRRQPALMQLAGTICSRCGQKHFPARRRCPACAAADLEPHAFPRGGRVLSYSVVRATPADFRCQVPFVAALVELEGGTRLSTTLTDISPEEVRIGMPVEMVTRRIREDGEDGAIVYGHKFRPCLPRGGARERTARAIQGEALDAGAAAPAPAPPLDDAAELDRFAAIPFEERALFLPHCLRDPKGCPATCETEGYACLECGRCSIATIKPAAEDLGYKVFVVPGGSMVEDIIRRHAPRAVLGIACHKELAEALGRCERAGLPAIGVPLLKDGCVATEADLPRALETLRLGATRPDRPAMRDLDLEGGIAHPLAQMEG